jgi:hypothetical protein
MSSLTCYSGNNSNENGSNKYGWENCYSASNNYNFNFPPKMADGRNWATWQPEAVVNQRIQMQEGIQTNWQYRMYLQQNGNQIMNYNTQEACYDLGLDPHVQTGKTPSSNVPYMFKNTFDRSKPGFGYCNSDLKNPYLSREQLNSRMVAPSINTANFSK